MRSSTIKLSGFIVALLISSVYPTAAYTSTDRPLAFIQLVNQHETLSGEFIQQRQLVGLTAKLTATGKLFFWRDKGLYWEMTQPFFYAYTFTPEQILHWQAPGIRSKDRSHNLRIEREVSRLLLAVFSGDQQALEKRFTLVSSTLPSAETSDNAKWQLHFKPNSSIGKKIIASLQLTGNDYIRQVQIISAQGDNTTITFTQIKPKAVLTPAICLLFNETTCGQ